MVYGKIGATTLGNQHKLGISKRTKYLIQHWKVNAGYRLWIKPCNREI